jgi:hypothetical protein
VLELRLSSTSDGSAGIPRMLVKRQPWITRDRSVGALSWSSWKDSKDGISSATRRSAREDMTIKSSLFCSVNFKFVTNVHTYICNTQLASHGQSYFQISFLVYSDHIHCVLSREGKDLRRSNLSPANSSVLRVFSFCNSVLDSSHSENYWSAESDRFGAEIYIWPRSIYIWPLEKPGRVG